MSDELKLAAMVHYSFLPDDYEDHRLRVAVTMRPLLAIGGDYCSILPLENNQLLICICDAVGHDISAALFAARINTYVLTHARADMIPCDLVAGLNAYLCKRLSETDMYATFYALLLDFDSGTMTLSGAAHPPALQLENDQEACREWPSITTLLGIDDPMPLLCGSERVPLNSGDLFLLYSDGLIEVEDAQANAYGIERLSGSLVASRRLQGQDLNEAILQQAESHAHDGYKDDVLLMSIAIK